VKVKRCSHLDASPASHCDLRQEVSTAAAQVWLIAREVSAAPSAQQLASASARKVRARRVSAHRACTALAHSTAPAPFADRLARKAEKAMKKAPNWVKIDGMRPAYAVDGNAIWNPTTHATDVTRQTHLHLVSSV
jgi:hypothetical protein